MKVLFVSSGNSEFFEIVPFVKSQGDSLKRKGIDLEYFTVQGKGFKGYLKNIKLIRKILRQKHFDIIHAHYSLSGWVALFAAFHKPIVLSLMGSDTYGFVNDSGTKTTKSLLMQVQVKAIQMFFNAIIVKSQNLERSVWRKKVCYIVPNGVNYSKFKPLNQKKCRQQLNLKQNEKIILFMGNTKDPRKNFTLFEQSLKFLKTENYRVVTPFPIKHDEMVVYYNACDVLVFPSIKEGSPNVIKEAIACNIPIVATTSGDIHERVEGLRNVLISKFDPSDFAEKIDSAFHNGKNDNSREKKREEIDEDIISEKIIDIYSALVNDKN